jgi:hypothetical protein
MTPPQTRASVPPVSAPPPPAPCPRCRADLAVIRRQGRPSERLIAHLCPSVTCGYKLIVPR